MTFDFDTLVNRNNSGNMKYIITPELIHRAGGITFSGAEMDFKTAPVIIEALTEKAQSGIYGYTLNDENYQNAVMSWMKNQRKWSIQAEWIVPTYGIMQGFCIAMRAFTQPGDGVILQTPLYMRYKADIEMNDRCAVSNPLIYKDNRYSIDFEQLEECMADEKNKIMVLCNPHNPVARVWNKDELQRIAVLAKKYDVLVYSDEIFAETTFGEHIAYPFSTIPHANDHCIVATSLGKTFNFTGFSHGNMIIPNEQLRDAFITQRNRDHYGSIDPFVYAAVLAAYLNGGDWVNAMVEYIYENTKLIQQFFKDFLPQVKVIQPEGSYILWIDWQALNLSEEELIDFLITEAYLQLDPGGEYGVEGAGFTRMNIATPRKTLKKSLDHLYTAAKQRGFAK